MSINRNLFIVVCFLIVIGMICLRPYHSKKYISKDKPVLKIKEPFIRGGNDFYIYNYYNVSIDVSFIPSSDIKTIEPGQRIGLNSSDVYKYLKNGSIIQVHTSVLQDRLGSPKEHKSPLLIGESKLILPEGKSIKSLHIGMSSGHDDLSMAGESTKSTLGTALPRVRLVNTTPRCLNLMIGSDKIRILPHSSHMYYGENNMGIHLGVIVRDQEGFLKDYHINKPITDLHLGIISDIKTPLHGGSKFGGDFDDTVDVVNYPMEIHGMGGPHNGSLADRSYIP